MCRKCVGKAPKKHCEGGGGVLCFRGLLAVVGNFPLRSDWRARRPSMCRTFLADWGFWSGMCRKCVGNVSETGSVPPKMCRKCVENVSGMCRKCVGAGSGGGGLREGPLTKIALSNAVQKTAVGRERGLLLIRGVGAACRHVSDTFPTHFRHLLDHKLGIPGGSFRKHRVGTHLRGFEPEVLETLFADRKTAA